MFLTLCFLSGRGYFEEQEGSLRRSSSVRQIHNHNESTAYVK